MLYPLLSSVFHFSTFLLEQNQRFWNYFLSDCVKRLGWGISEIYMFLWKRAVAFFYMAWNIIKVYILGPSSQQSKSLKNAIFQNDLLTPGISHHRLVVQCETWIQNSTLKQIQNEEEIAPWITAAWCWRHSAHSRATLSDKRKAAEVYSFLNEILFCSVCRSG